MESMHVGDWIAFATLIVTIIAVCVAVVTLRKGNKNASVAALIALNESFREVLRMLIDDEYASEQIPKMLHAPSTFCNIKGFLNSKRKLSVTIPPQWYQESR
jgi:hypothetical protein